MSVFKCKMCGGTLEINNNESVATCEYCGTQQTLPRLDDERRANLYDRANHFRRNNDYDKAMGIYETILNEDTTDAEAYWSLVLCRYGIEYVEDPASHKRIPTVNRAQFTSVFDDDNYKSALQYADGYQKSIYEEEAKAINEIQKGILEISQKEEPFDVFICYKETDANGRRTPDSVLATELYHELCKEGFKVFFARITLEDKLGTAYEPYIFAALNSAKVMVVLGTKQEYFNAVWVKNEWSRYLSLIKSGAKKMLIPAYKDMDPYDLPEEFSHLQAQDMSKLGFMQDLIRGIKKIAQTDEPKATIVKETVVTGGNANIAPLLERAFMFLEDGDWQSADEYCEKVLDIDPKNATAYLGKLLSELRVRNQETLKEQAEPFDYSNNYQKAVRFADAKLKTALAGYIEHINTRNENARLDSIYTRAKKAMSSANTESDYKKTAHLFESISEYQDATALANKCYEKAEIARKDTILSEGKSKMSGEIISNYESAIKLFESISGWKDADEKVYACQKKIEEIKAKEEAERLEKERIAKRNKKIDIIATPIVCAVTAFIILLNTVIIPNGKYNDAIALMNAGNVVEAYETLVALDGYKDSADKANSIYDQYKVEKLKVAKAGDYVFFGAYEQDNSASNGKEHIEWLVLEVKDGKALVISKYALDCKQYNTNYTDVTWEACTLRRWLNNDFINAA
ncbi:MAG: TIR domain-containing protein, partial [Oscillospiraceae bacterium]|nr:TIR domain-containing protein [Oscillospiraceae bacterium]